MSVSLKIIANQNFSPDGPQLEIEADKFVKIVSEMFERPAQLRATSKQRLHIFDVSVYPTSAGEQIITAAVPNVSSEALRNLDGEGVIRVGSLVQPADILVGKVSPRDDSPITPEEKLLRAIFGETDSKFRDVSMRLPPGIQGIVSDVQVFRKYADDKTGAISSVRITVDTEPNESVAGSLGDYGLYAVSIMDVVLPVQRQAVIAEIANILAMTQPEARRLIHKLPAIIGSGFDQATALDVGRRLDAVGAVVSIGVPLSKAHGDLDLIGDEDWEEIKAEALKLIEADRLDTPSGHLTYLRQRFGGQEIST